jgi:hypothetical protein
MTFGDLRDRLEVLRVACSKCESVGQYRVERLIERYGADTGLPDWKDVLTADCALRAKPSANWDLCGAHFFDLPAVMSQSVQQGLRA